MLSGMQEQRCSGINKVQRLINFLNVHNPATKVLMIHLESNSLVKKDRTRKKFVEKIVNQKKVLQPLFHRITKIPVVGSYLLIY